MSQSTTTISANRQQFLADVKHEIRMLKTHATPEELNRLNLKLLNPTSSELCIYGQMTHNCESLRAKELMDLACIRVFHTNNVTGLTRPHY